MAKTWLQFANKEIRKVYLFTFFLAMANSCWVYVASSYIEKLTGQANVSWFYLIAYALALIALLNLHKAVRTWGARKIFFTTTLGRMLMFGLLFLPIGRFAILVPVLYIVIALMVDMCLDMILESHSNDADTGSIRGTNLIISGWGFIAGPLISMNILNYFGFTGVFALLIAINLLILFLALKYLPDHSVVPAPRETVRALLKKVWQRSDVKRIFLVSLSLEYFFALMIIYSPLYLRELGFSWSNISLAFTIILTPFLFLGLPVGLLADRRYGEKRLISLALAWLGLATTGLFFLRSGNLLAWTALLLFGRIAAATLETLRDSYFYKRIGGGDYDLIDFYRTAYPLGGLIAALFSAVFLIFFPLSSIFWLIAIGVWLAILAAVRLPVRNN